MRIYNNLKAHISLVIISRWFTLHTPSSNRSRSVLDSVVYSIVAIFITRSTCAFAVIDHITLFTLFKCRVIHLITHIYTVVGREDMLVRVVRVRRVCTLIVSQIKLHYHVLSYFITRTLTPSQWPITVTRK